MKYQMTVVIEEPNVEPGMVSQIVMRLNAAFSHNPKTYGSGYFLTVADEEERFRNSYDLRYDREFDSKAKIAYLEKWARGYWNGENGAFALKSIDIREA